MFPSRRADSRPGKSDKGELKKVIIYTDHNGYKKPIPVPARIKAEVRIRNRKFLGLLYPDLKLFIRTQILPSTNKK
jgi:hypothetical protein